MAQITNIKPVSPGTRLSIYNEQHDERQAAEATKIAGNRSRADMPRNAFQQRDFIPLDQAQIRVLTNT